MSRTVLAIKMLTILNANTIISRKELADRLDVRVRYISLLRDELIQCGFQIKTKFGNQGGYILENKKQIGIHQNTYFIEFLLNYIRNKELFPMKKECLSILENELSENQLEINTPNIYSAQFHYNRKKILQKYLDICFEAIEKSMKLIITYNDIKTSVFTFSPYDFSDELGLWRIRGKAIKDNLIINLEIKLENIIKIEKTEQTFHKTIKSYEIFSIQETSYTNTFEIYLKVNNELNLDTIKIGLNKKIVTKDEKTTTYSFLVFSLAELDLLLRRHKNEASIIKIKDYSFYVINKES